MNADTTGTRSPHLGLEDLIAEAAGQQISGRARAHLIACQDCRAEAIRWGRVADGIRGLAAATPDLTEPVQRSQPAKPVEPAKPVQPPQAATTAKPVRPRRITPHWPAGHSRRSALAVSAAAAVALLAGAGYVADAALTGHGPGGGTILTGVGGCATLAQASGTLERASGTSLVIETAGGHPVTVDTTAATRLSVSGHLTGDITDGALATVLGLSSGGTVAAFIVAVQPAGGTTRPSLSAPGMVTVAGTVADAGPAGFTVVEPGGTRIRVTTTGSTVVTVFRATEAQLQPGASTIAVGRPGPHGTLSAVAVFQTLASPPGAHARVTVHDCSPASVDRAIMALSAGA